MSSAPPCPPELADVAIVGAGAAGLMAGIWAGRGSAGRRIVLLDGARRPGAKILVSGGGRCNVTHDQVDASAYAGSSPHAIGKVLRRFDACRTAAFFSEIGVPLVREEETGKLFPASGRARSVLEALLKAAKEAGAELFPPCRVESVTRTAEGFVLAGQFGLLRARRVVLATGGKSLPETGSDGHGFAIARSLGLALTERVFPALVPLTLPPGHFLRALTGVSAPALLELWSGAGKRLAAASGAVLCAHFGLSGPAVLDISRHVNEARHRDAKATLTANWLPGTPPAELDRALRPLGAERPLAFLRGRLPERLARALCEHAGVHVAAPGSQLTRAARAALVRAVTRLPLPISGDRGFRYAEVTAGGVPLSEIRLQTMEARACPGLHLCGEICDVDGKIGGYNFQWAWASGYTAGVSLSH